MSQTMQQITEKTTPKKGVFTPKNTNSRELSGVQAKIGGAWQEFTYTIIAKSPIARAFCFILVKYQSKTVILYQ